MATEWISSPLPSSTATPLVLPTPEADGDVLTPEQKRRLWQTSLTFLASTQEGAELIAGRIDYVEHPDPSNMCGPLAIAELRASLSS